MSILSGLYVVFGRPSAAGVRGSAPVPCRTEKSVLSAEKNTDLPLGDKQQKTSPPDLANMTRKEFLDVINPLIKQEKLDLSDAGMMLVGLGIPLEDFCSPELLARLGLSSRRDTDSLGPERLNIIEKLKGYVDSVRDAGDRALSYQVDAADAIQRGLDVLSREHGFSEIAA